jgi:hypothetical protein
MDSTKSGYIIGRNMDYRKKGIFHLTLLLTLGNLGHHVSWARMEFVGPIVTMTLKDPSLEATRLDGQKRTSLFGSKQTLGNHKRQTTTELTTLSSKITTTTTTTTTTTSPWWSDLRSLNPQIHWSIQSRSGQLPLPNWFPQLKFLRATLGYSTESISEKNNGGTLRGVSSSSIYASTSAISEMDLLPSTTLDTEIRLARDGWGELDLLPSYDFHKRKWTYIVQATRGSTARIWMKLSWGGRKNQSIMMRPVTKTAAAAATSGYESFIWPTNIGTSNSATRSCFDFLQGNFVWNLRSTSLSSLSAIKMSPSYDFSQRLPSCSLEGITGSGRTKAILNLQYHQPTLSIVHAIDERCVRFHRSKPRFYISFEKVSS